MSTERLEKEKGPAPANKAKTQDPADTEELKVASKVDKIKDTIDDPDAPDAGEVKPDARADPNGARFVKELLDGDPTYAVSSDRIHLHPEEGWILFDFLRCVSVPPQKSHPNRYWFKNSRKFNNLWNLAQAPEGQLYLVNYADDHDLGVRLIQVQDIDKQGVCEENIKNMDWETFQGWFRTLNHECGR